MSFYDGNFFDSLFHLITLLGRWGYLVLFLAAFLECSAFLGLVVPGETIVVLAGFISSQGYLDLGDSIWVIALGAVLGDTAGYSLGKAVGLDYFTRHRRLLFIKKRHLERAVEYFRIHGGKTIFLGRFIGFFRAMSPFAAGMLGMPYGRFLLYNVTGGVLWTVVFTLLGYFFGESWQAVEKWSGRTGVFVLFLLVVVSAFFYIYRKIAARKEEIISRFRTGLSALAERPGIRRFIERHPAFVNFVTERLSPRGYLGLHLTAGIVLSAILIWIFGGITEDVLTGDPLVLVDRWVLERVTYFRSGPVTAFFLMVTYLGGGAAIGAVSAVVVFILLLRRRFEAMVTYAAAITCGSLLVLVMKSVFKRPRPAVEAPLLVVHGWSFPSAHAMMSPIMYGMIAYFLIRAIRSWRRRVFIATTAAFLVFLIGMSRIYLGVHYLSDILAGFTGGLFWLTVCITGLEVYRKKKGTGERREA